jgi:pimeloyl-ACP methyl ester carboxylesterase
LDYLPRCGPIGIGSKRQLADWEAAISYARTLDGIDPERIALWGSSFSGGHAVVTAARDKLIVAVVAQVPFMDGFTVLRKTPLRAALRLTVASLRDEFRRLLNKPPYYVKIAGAPGTLAAMTSPDAEPGMRALLPLESKWRDTVAARVLLRVTLYRPINSAAKVQCPLLICVCDNDVVTPPSDAMKAARLAPRGELCRYPGGHFDIYVGKLFGQAVADQSTFLTKLLLQTIG